MTEQSVEQETKVEESQDPVENEDPSVEEQLAQAIKKNHELVQAYNKLANHANSLESALTMANAKNAQLEANVKVLRDHRELFMEREADAAVNADLNEQRLNRDLKNMEAERDNAKKEQQPLQARIHQAETSLKEVRELFGKVKHRQKEAETEIAGREKDLNEAVEALEWYSKVSSGIQFSITRRFAEKCNQELTADLIINAARFAKHCKTKINKNNIVSFLVAPSKFQ